MVPPVLHTPELIRLHTHDMGSSFCINYNSIRLLKEGASVGRRRGRSVCRGRRSGSVSLGDPQ